MSKIIEREVDYEEIIDNLIRIIARLNERVIEVEYRLETMEKPAKRSPKIQWMN